MKLNLFIFLENLNLNKAILYINKRSFLNKLYIEPEEFTNLKTCISSEK